MDPPVVPTAAPTYTAPNVAPQSYPSPAAPQGYPSPAAPQGYPNPGMPQGYPNPGMPQGYPNPAAPQGYPNPGVPQGYPNPGVPQGYPNPGVPQGYPSPSAPQNYPNPPTPQGYPNPSAPQGYPSPSAPQNYPNPSAPQGYPSPSSNNTPAQNCSEPPAPAQVPTNPPAPQPAEQPVIQGYNASVVGPTTAFVGANNGKEGASVNMQVMSYNQETISGEDMRSAVAAMVGKKLFWGKGAVKNMQITDIQTGNSYHCRWETFMEKRKTEWEDRPYKGGAIDGPANGIAPQPWEISVNMPNLFTEDEVKKVVPHTEYVQQCEKCFGRGHTQCKNCNGRGRVKCTSCNGRGYSTNADNQRQTCYRCNGDGFMKCYNCDGMGLEKCKKCDGKGSVVKYVELTVKFKNHVQDIVVNNFGIPDDVIQKSEGSIMSQQMGYRILPPQDIFEPAIRNACSSLYTTAENKIAENKERLLQERVTVRVIPVAKAKGTWKDKTMEFWVHGNNKVAYAPSYLKDFYHGCSIMYYVCYKQNL